jgi:ferric-dicitrate binding protein FerR (iron transport regulator)
MLYTQISELWERSAKVEHPVFDAKKAFKKHKQLIQAENPTPIKSSSNKQKIFALIAILAILLITLFIFKWNEPAPKVIEANEKLMFATLEDGTEIWLNKGSKLTYSIFESSSRNVKLEGKAYFNVAENTEAPFTITTDNIDIRVIGTKFIVDTYNKKVLVREGKVEVSNENSDNKIIVTKDQSISLEGKAFSSVKNEEFVSDLLWFNEDLIFDNTPFDIVVRDISASFNVNIELPGSRNWTNCTFTSGSLRNNTFTQILNTLQLTYELKYEKMDDKAYRFTSVKCK